MVANNKNEIIKLLKNIQLSRFLEHPCWILDDLNSNIVLSSLYMLLRRDDYPIHFDKMGTGNFVPDIVLYRCPPLYDERIQLTDFENIKDFEEAMGQHIIAIEHFKIGNFSYIKKNKKVVNKISEYEAKLYRLDDTFIEKINDLQRFVVKDKIDIYTSFRAIYKKHFFKLDNYKEKIKKDNLLGHAVHPDGNYHNVEIWFLIECDDCIFINEYGQEIPIFLTKMGKDIIDEIGIPDGLIYYGRTGIFAFSKNTLNSIMVSENVIFGYPQKEQYVRFMNTENFTFLYKNNIKVLKVKFY